MSQEDTQVNCSCFKKPTWLTCRRRINIGNYNTLIVIHILDIFKRCLLCFLCTEMVKVFFFSGLASRARVLEISPFDLPKLPPVTQAKVWVVTFSLFSVSTESMIQICYLLIMIMDSY